MEMGRGWREELSHERKRQLDWSLELIAGQTALNRLRIRLIKLHHVAQFYISSPTDNNSMPSLLTMDERTRSRSPRRKPDGERARPKRSDGGFRWKDKKREDDPRSGWDERRLERGYRDREDRGRAPPKEKDADRDQARYRDSDRERDRERERERDRERKGPEDEARREKKKKKKAAAPEQPSEAMITVIVNDRLGTKAAIPCLGSDPISLSPSIC